LVTFANASLWGYNGYIAPQASVSDGWMDVVVIGKQPWIKLPMLAIKLVTKQFTQTRGVEFFRCKHALLQRETGGYVHYDGEPQTMSSAIEIKIVPQALKVICGGNMKL
jgi:diacylglycerol kinase family enzyme